MPLDLHTGVDQLDYEQIVNSLYEPLYRFGLSLTRNRDEACELTQETFCRLLSKGGQLRDHTKVKAWMFTTLYRVYIGWKRREVRLPHFEIDSIEEELEALAPEMAAKMDAATVRDALFEIDERYRAPLVLFYLEEQSYREIAELLEVPCGTVMSRLSRGKDLLRKLLVAKRAGVGVNKVVPLGKAIARTQVEHD